MTSGDEFPVARLQPAVTYMRISVLSQHKSPLRSLRTVPAVRHVPSSSLMQKNFSRHASDEDDGVDVIYN